MKNSNDTVWEFLGKKIDFDIPQVMGILNITPDSFYDGGQHQNENKILHRVEKMLEEGAAIIDIGGYSTRPGALDVSIDEEINRVKSCIALVSKTFQQAIISIDTFRAEVAKIAVDCGASIVNDVSGGSLDANMFAVVEDLKTPFVMMHMRGTPQTMQTFCQYDNVVLEVVNELNTQVNEVKKYNIDKIIIDPGFGFSKTIDQNFELLKGLNEFTHLQLPIMVGLSRKSMIWKTLDTSPQNALNGTTALHAVALSKGANILRVHDVKEAIETIKLFQKL